jgi:HAD superfamily hydrolase (TIGR01509 family)
MRAEPALVIFDCDSVLVDSEILVVEIEAELLSAEGVTMTVEQVIATCVGLSEVEMHRRIEGEWGVRLSLESATRTAERIEAAFARALEPVPGMAALLQSLERRRCVASSSTLPRIRRSLERTGLLHHFGSSLYSATMVPRGKPAPDLFLHAARAMGAPADACVVVEDSPFGVAAGKAAGMFVVGFTAASHCSERLPAQLAAAGADVVVADADGLRALIA